MIIGCWLYMLIGIVLSTTGGVLIKNGQITSCEVIDIGQVAVFVSANCLDYTEHAQLNNSTKYEVAMLEGSGRGFIARKFSTDNIHVHPEYNAQSLENNIAVIQLGIAPPSIMSNIATTQYTTGNVFYKRLMLPDKSHEDNMLTISSTANQQCSSSSDLYNLNAWAFTCTLSYSNITSDVKMYKNVPYGSGDIMQGKYSFSLYSHSVVEDNEYWKSQSMVSYYTVVAHYIQFANSKLNAKISYYDADKKLGTDVSGSWKLTLPPTQKHVIIVGGDLYSLQDTTNDENSESAFARPEISSSLPITNSKPSESNIPTLASVETIGETNNEGKSLSSGAIAGIVVGVVALLILVSLAIYWASRVSKKRRAEAYWDREMENMKSMRSLAQLPTKP